MAIRKGVTIYHPVYIHPTVKVGKGTRIGAFCDIGKGVEAGGYMQRKVTPHEIYR